MSIFIRNGKRFNILVGQFIEQPVEGEEGVTESTFHGDFSNPDTRAQLGITEIPEPSPPEGYVEKNYYRTEQDDAPYVVYTPKSQEQLATQYEQEIRAQKDAINAARDIDMVAGVTHNGKIWHCNDSFLLELLGMVLGYQAGVFAPGSTQIIRTKQDTLEELTLTEIVELASVVGNHRKAVYAASWQTKDALDAQPNPYAPPAP